MNKVSSASAVALALTAVLVFTGASCSKTGEVRDGGTDRITGEESGFAGNQLGTAARDQQVGSSDQESQATSPTDRTIDSEVATLLSAEFGSASNDQTDAASGDAEDRTFVTSDTESFNSVGALGSEYTYE